MVQLELEPQVLEIDIPVYETEHYKYIRISDLKEEYEKLELTRWIFGQTQPLIQGKGKGVPAITDAIFLHDYIKFLDYKAGKQVFID
jgi:hypothetical protein